MVLIKEMKNLKIAYPWHGNLDDRDIFLSLRAYNKRPIFKLKEL